MKYLFVEGDSMCKTTQTEDLVKETVAAEMLGISAMTLRRWRCQGKGPCYVKFGTNRSSAVRYMPSVVAAWIDNRCCDPEAAE